MKFEIKAWLLMRDVPITAMKLSLRDIDGAPLFSLVLEFDGLVRLEARPKIASTATWPRLRALSQARSFCESLNSVFARESNNNAAILV